jgi:hypothetical protein
MNIPIVTTGNKQKDAELFSSLCNGQITFEDFLESVSAN